MGAVGWTMTMPMMMRFHKPKRAMETRSTAGRRGYSIVVFLIRHGSAPGEKLPILA
jgi:hypothetical protein